MANAITNISNKVRNEVAEDGIIKEQVHLEELTSKTWEEKWGFMKDFEKITLEIAANLGYSPSEYKRMANKKHKLKDSMISDRYVSCKPSPPVPTTSSGFVGWRCKDPVCSLEICGPLHISPKYTIDPPGGEKLPITQIILG